MFYRILKRQLLRLMSLFATIVVLQFAFEMPAHARSQFGSEDKIKKIADLSMRGDRGEVLYLGYRMKVYSFFAPVFMTKEGYVLGFSDDTTRYIQLDTQKITELQNRGQLPSPLPVYRLSWGDWFYGYFTWWILGGIAIVFSVYRLVTRAIGTTTSAGRPLTIAAMAARSNRFRLIFLVLPLLILLAFAWLFHGIWVSVIRGPLQATGAEIAAARLAGGDHQWFALTEKPRNLSVNRSLKTHDQYGDVKKFKYFLYILPGTPSLIVESKHSNLNAPFYAWPSDGSISDENFARAKQIATKLGYTSIAPFMLTASDKTPNHTRIGTAIFLTLIAAPLLILLYGIYRAVLGLADPLKTNDVRQLLKSVRAKEGLPALVAEIDAEAANAKVTLKHRGSLLLPSWLIDNAVPFTLISTQDVIWVVAQELTENSFGVKIAHHAEIQVFDRFGRRLFFRVNDVDAVLHLIMSRAPWAFFGHDAAMQRVFYASKQTLPTRLKDRQVVKRIRTELIRRVDERREAILRKI